MSGRSAIVRKEKTKLKDESKAANDLDAALDAFPLPYGSDLSDIGHDHHHINRTARSISSNSDDTAYARVKKPVVPALNVSGIEKSSFRSVMDKKTDGVRKGLAAMTFRKKKKATVADPRPATAATIRARDTEPMRSENRSAHRPGSSDSSQAGPPYGKLPPVPPGPQLRRWAGAGRAPHNWNKLRKDPELWDPHGDTLVYLCHSTPPSTRLAPSIRLSSHVLEATRSRFFFTMLRDGYVDLNSDVESPSSSSIRGLGYADPDGQISYEIFFPAPPNQTKIDTLRWHATTRNVFAILNDASLVGLDLYQALKDVQQRLKVYLPLEIEPVDLIINYLTKGGIDDVRDDPESAVALLCWSDEKNVQWYEGWREAFVHAVGMYDRAQMSLGMTRLSPITSALLERVSLESQVRIEAAQERLRQFDFFEMWPATVPVATERGCFDRLRMFFLGFYEAQMGRWPPQSATGDDQWLTRDLAQRLQSDFGALYDYLVNRDVRWDCAEERSSRKWTMVSSSTRRLVEPDTATLPLIDMLIAFDNAHRFPHIPHPYPLVPASIAPPPVPPQLPPPSRETLHKANRKNTQAVSAPDTIQARRMALSYAEATNIYALGPDFAANRMVEGFVRFEKVDRPAGLDLAAARLGRWVLIYGVLQVLATVSVDTPLLRYKDGVSYHLHPHLRGTPPWRGAAPTYEEATHEHSHCWRAPEMWAAAASNPPPSRYSATTEAESDTTSSVRSPSSSAGRSSRPRWPLPRSASHDADSFKFTHVERVNLWPITAEDKTEDIGDGLRVAIRDFDDL